jgi:hypothetical protein
MLEKVISKAVELFNTEEFDDANELLSAKYAWDWALELTIQTDHEALELLTEITSDARLKPLGTYWDGDGSEFYILANAALYGNEGFAQMVADEIENYDEIYSERKARAEARAANL